MCWRADEANYADLQKAEDQAEQFDDAATDDGSWDEFLMEATQVRPCMPVLDSPPFLCLPQPDLRPLLEELSSSRQKSAAEQPSSMWCCSTDMAAPRVVHAELADSTGIPLRKAQPSHRGCCRHRRTGSQNLPLCRQLPTQMPPLLLLLTPRHGAVMKSLRPRTCPTPPSRQA